jgi:hypothetical protein
LHSDILERYIDKMRTTVGQGSISSNEEIDSRAVVDMVAYYSVSGNQELL